MAFNFKAFATAFMDDQARAIQKRIQDAEDYEDQKREEAERNKALVGKRRALVNLAKTEINLLKKMGAKDRHINAAIAAGPKVLFEFSQSLQREAQKRPSSGGNVTFSESELDALIEMPDEFAVESMDPAEHYANSIGLAEPSIGSYQAKRQGLLKTALGIGLKDATRARLDKDAYYEGYSVMDINEIARQEAYESMDPGTYFSFKPTKDYDPTRIGPAFLEQMADAADLPQSVLSSIQRQFEGDPNEAKLVADETKRIIERRQNGVIESYTSQYGDQFLTDPGIDLKSIMGERSYLAKLEEYASEEDLKEFFVEKMLDMENTSVGTPIKIVDNDQRVVEITIGPDKKTVSQMTVDNKKVPEDRHDEALSALYKAGLLSEASFQGSPLGGEDATPSALGTVEYIEDGKVVKGVPPRPSAFMSRITGVSLDYDERQKILSGEMAIPERGLRVDEWDELFGDTHNPDGSPKAGTAQQEIVDKPVESGILDLRKYETMEEKYEAFDALPIGGRYYDDDGSGPHTKGMERDG